MSGFSQCSVTHTFTTPTNTGAAGTVTFVLSKRMTNNGVSIIPGEVTANLDNDGAMSVALFANNDPGTIPADAQWMCTIRLAGQSQEEYGIVVPTGGGTVDLGTLLPQQEYGG